jgi:hypothetical protein
MLVFVGDIEGLIEVVLSARWFYKFVELQQGVDFRVSLYKFGALVGEKGRAVKHKAEKMRMGEATVE